MPKLEEKINSLEEELQFLDDSNELPPEDVFAFNELRSCADLFRLYENKTLELHPDFQRDIVWGNTDQTRFIDSLVKHLPIPSLCFSLDAKSGKMQVIDGLQRIFSICQFLGKNDWRLSDLDDIDQKISGKTVQEIKEKNKDIFEKVQNLSLPVTLLRCDYNKPNHTEYIFTIFRRLNTGGMKLTNQEIRNAVYAGTFNNLLKECNDRQNWRLLLQRTTGQKNADDRFKSVELVLRFFSFFETYDSYRGKLTSFLNSYMQNKRHVAEKEIQRKKELFLQTILIAKENIFEKKLKGKLSAATLEAVLFGLAKNVEYLNDLIQKDRGDKIKARYESLIKEKPFQTENLSEGLYKKQATLERLKLASRIFSKNA